MNKSPQNIGILNTIDSVASTHRFSHQAMGAIYEIFIIHEDANYAQEAAYEAFSELDRLEQELSRFIENSDISRINNLLIDQSVTIGLAAFGCLKHSAQMYRETDGAFDITIGPLLKCWQNQDKTSRIPSNKELELAQRCTGSNHLLLDEKEHTVKMSDSPVQVDLGGIGKGYAIDQMVELLRDWEFDRALVHGGSSSLFALGAPPGTIGWPVTLCNPQDYQNPLAYLHLRDQAFSGSGLQKGQHIIDPRTAQPVKNNRAAWALASNAATSDALSTAFMIMSPAEIEKYCRQNQDVLAMIVTGENNGGKDKIISFGL